MGFYMSVFIDYYNLADRQTIGPLLAYIKIIQLGNSHGSAFCYTVFENTAV